MPLVSGRKLAQCYVFANARLRPDKALSEQSIKGFRIVHEYKVSSLSLNRKAIFSVLVGVIGLVMVPSLFSLLAIGLGSCAVKEASEDRLVEKILSLVGLGLGLIGVGAMGAWISFVLITLAFTMLV